MADSNNRAPHQRDQHPARSPLSTKNTPPNSNNELQYRSLMGTSSSEPTPGVRYCEVCSMAIQVPQEQPPCAVCRDVTAARLAESRAFIAQRNLLSQVRATVIYIDWNSEWISRWTSIEGLVTMYVFPFCLVCVRYRWKTILINR